MKTREEIAKSALEHIMVGHDAACHQCGWMGAKEDVISFFFYICPDCKCQSIVFGPDKMALCALEQCEKVQSNAG